MCLFHMQMEWKEIHEYDLFLYVLLKKRLNRFDISIYIYIKPLWAPFTHLKVFHAQRTIHTIVSFHENFGT